MIGSDPVLTEMSENLLASDALLSVGTPPLSPFEFDPFSLESRDLHSDEDAASAELTHAKASWLDAMPVTADPLADLTDGVASVNEDENGLYHMFVGITP